MNILVESMTKILAASGYVIRVWREQSDIQDEYNNTDLYTAVYRHQAKNAQDGNSICIKPTVLIKELLELGRVNAVEIVDKGGVGVVAYKNWP
jgi:hypothetical protein